MRKFILLISLSAIAEHLSFIVTHSQSFMMEVSINSLNQQMNQEHFL